MVRKVKHSPKSYAAGFYVSGYYTTFYIFSCTPCQVHGMQFRTPEARDQYAQKHLAR